MLSGSSYRVKVVYDFKEIIFTGNEKEYTIKMGKAKGGKSQEGTHKSDIDMKDWEELVKEW